MYRQQEWGLSNTTVLQSDLIYIMHNIWFDSKQDRRLFHSANCPVQLQKPPNLLLDWQQGLIHQSPKSPQGESGHPSLLHAQFTSPTPYPFHDTWNDNFTCYCTTTIRSDTLFHSQSTSDWQVLALIFLLRFVCLRSSLWTQIKGTAICSLS
jgi:hypothetical protein